MQRCEFRRTKPRFGGHEIFPKEIGMLHHGALEWLKDHAALFQIFRNDVALDELIIRENHPASVMIEAARILQNIFAIIFGERTANLVRREVEQTDIGKSPRLIFPCWV